jgi:hypothetical protein
MVPFEPFPQANSDILFSLAVFCLFKMAKAVFDGSAACAVPFADVVFLAWDSDDDGFPDFAALQGLPSEVLFVSFIQPARATAILSNDSTNLSAKTGTSQTVDAKSRW